MNAENITPKQAKFVELLEENIKKEGKRDTLGQIALKAGYSQEKSEKPITIIRTKAVQNRLKSLLSTIESKRNESLSYLTKDKLQDSSARDLVGIFDILTKNHQLLGGNATERIELAPAQKQEIDDIFDNNE
jgi:phage terminase small subunit